MLIVETVAQIRHEHFIKGKTIKEIARDLKVSQNTIRKVLMSGETSFEYERSIQPRPKLERWAPELDELRAANAAKPVAQADPHRDPKFEAGIFDHNMAAADTVEAHKARIGELTSMFLSAISERNFEGIGAVALPTASGSMPEWEPANIAAPSSAIETINVRNRRGRALTLTISLSPRRV